MGPHGHKDEAAGQGGGRYRFGGVVVDAAAHTLVRDGAPHPVEPKAFAVLLVLLEHRGELVVRDQLLDAVWGHRHVTPGVLTRAIAQLRAALDDDPQQPRYIQTQHALGYRFIGELQADAVLAQTPAEEISAAPPIELVMPLPGSPPVLPTPIPAPPPGPVSALAQPRPRRLWPSWWLAGGAVLVMTIATAAATWWLHVLKPHPESPSIAVMPFVNLSSNRDDDYFAEGLAVEMHDALAGVEGLKVAAQMTPSADGARMPDVRTLGKMLGVASVLEATVRREGPRVRINARLRDTGSGFTLWSHTYDHQVADVFNTQQAIAEEVLRSLTGAIPQPRDGLARRLAPTASLAAFEAYLKGARQLRQGPGNADVALGFFRQALAADGGFARAQLGVCRSETLRFEALRNADSLARAQVACRAAGEIDDGSGEVELVLGDLYRVSGELDRAMGYYQRASGKRAAQADAYVGIAQIYSAQEQQPKALAYFDRALALRPGDPTIHGEIGYRQYLAGNMAQAIASYRKATELRPGDAELWSSLGGLYLVSGDNAAAEAAFQRSIALGPTDAALSNYGELKFQRGDYATAARMFRRATELDSGDFLIWGNLGDALKADPATAAQAREPYLIAAGMATRYVEIKPDDAMAIAALGWYRANLGEPLRARELVARAEALKSGIGDVSLFNALTLMAVGEEAQARRRLAQARAAGVPETRIAGNPFLRHPPRPPPASIAIPRP